MCQKGHWQAVQHYHHLAKPRCHRRKIHFPHHQRPTNHHHLDERNEKRRVVLERCCFRALVFEIDGKDLYPSLAVAQRSLTSLMIASSGSTGFWNLPRPLED